MLNLTRKPGEQLRIGDDVVITVVRVKRDGSVSLGIEAPRDVPVHREEVWEEIQRNKPKQTSEFGRLSELEFKQRMPEVAALFPELLRKLSFREREILKLRYGLGSEGSYTLQETAHIFKVTKERVRQLESKAVDKLRSWVRALAVTE